MIMKQNSPITFRSMTLWGAGGLLVVNGLLCAAAIAFEPVALTSFAQAAAGDVGPSFQIGTGMGMLGIRRRL